MFGSSRTDTRRVFVAAWRKRRAGEPLEPLERTLAAVIEAHPEYHGILERADALTRDFFPETGDENPFMHLGLHVALIEQLDTDRPAGIRALHASLRRRYADVHALEHAIMGCLADSLREAQASGAMPDERRYLECVRRLAKIRVL